MVWISGLVPYEKASAVFERIGHRHIPESSILTQTRLHGARLKAYEDRQQDYVGVERVKLPPPGCDHDRQKGVSMDGGMVHIRGEGWKEFKVGTVFDVELGWNVTRAPTNWSNAPMPLICPTPLCWVQ